MFAEAAEAALLVSSELIRSRIVAIRAVSFMMRPQDARRDQRRTSPSLLSD